MMCEGLAAAFGETNRSVTDVIIKSQSSVGGITAEIRQSSPISFLGVDVEKARKHMLPAYEGSFVKDTQMMDT
jgi:hypothetical protein